MVPSTIDFPHIGIVVGYSGYGHIDYGDCYEYGWTDYYYN